MNVSISKYLYKISKTGYPSNIPVFKNWIPPCRSNWSNQFETNGQSNLG